MEFLVTAFMNGEKIETIASRHELHERFDWCEDDPPILEIEGQMTITIRRATHEDLIRLRN